MKHINITYSDRCEAVSKVIWQLCTMNIAINEIDMNRAQPVITVQANAAVKKLQGYCYMRISKNGQRIHRKQAQLGSCRVEWEELVY